MKNLIGTRFNLSFLFAHFRSMSKIVGLGFGLLLAAGGFLIVTGAQKPGPEVCKASNVDLPGLTGDDSTDGHAVATYTQTIAQLFQEEKFEQLDCIAYMERSGKRKFSGGLWKLHNFYNGLDSPQLHATESDWKVHLKRLRRWESQEPDSITARVALAHSYISYGWVARGEGASDTVSDDGWKLFTERIGAARKILEKASKLTAKCPEWYVAMQDVALAQGWDVAQAKDLLDQAVAFEPNYYYYYRMHANFLQPKWYGKTGDSEQFAEAAADRVGGGAGDILYFQMAAAMICHCGEEVQLNLMSWPRIQRGFDALEQQSGASMTNLNLLSFMAIKNKDAVTADKAFARIGSERNEDTWRSQKYFETSRTWAAQIAPSMAWRTSLEEAADVNLRSADGPGYKTAFNRQFEGMAQKCMQVPRRDDEKFEMLIRVSKEGGIEQVLTNPSTPVSNCLMQSLVEFQVAKATPFPVPPTPSYWLRLDLDPATIPQVTGNSSKP